MSGRGHHLHWVEERNERTGNDLVISMAGSAFAAAEQQIPWQTSLEAAYKEAAASHRPLVVYYRGTDCEWCRRLDAEIESASASIVGGAVWVRLNPDFDDAGRNAYRLAKALNLTRYPTVFVIRAMPDAFRELGRVVGYKPRAEWFAAIGDLLGERPPSAPTTTPRPRSIY